MRDCHKRPTRTSLFFGDAKLPSRNLLFIILSFSIFLNVILVLTLMGDGGSDRRLQASDPNASQVDPVGSGLNERRMEGNPAGRFRETGGASGSSAEGSEGGHGSAGHDYHTYPGITFLIICFLVAALLEYINQQIEEAYRPPYTVVLFVVGMAFGPLGVTKPHLGANGSMIEGAAAGMYMFSQLDAHTMLFVFLPILLYESASNMTWHVFKRVLPSSILMAVPGVVINILLIGGVFVLMNDGSDVTWNFSSAFLLASVLSATDPVAVVAALQSLGAPKKLSTLVEGESLLNDGSAMVAFYVFLDMVTKPGSVTFATVIRDFFRLAFGGAAFGCFTARIMLFWLRRVRHLHIPILEVAIVVVFVYGTFFIAEQDPFKFSGVIAVVTLGTHMSAGGMLSLSHHGAHAHHTVVSQMAYWCNQAIFFVAGVICERFMFGSHLSQKGQMWGHLVILYILIHVTRGLVVLIFSPFLKRLGYGVTWKEMVILVFGGLRGAVGLAMALMVESNKAVNRDVAEILVFHVSGIVLFTLFINGSTVDQLYGKLNLYPANPFRMVYVDKALKKLEKECKKAIDQVHNDWFFGDVNFDALTPCLPDFSRVGFDSVGRIVFERPKEVVKTLNDLEEEAQLYRAKHRRKGRPKDSIGEKEESVKGQKLWAVAKHEVVKPQAFMLAKPKAKFALNADTFVRVKCVNADGGKHIILTEDTNKGGLYVSARTLTQIGMGHEFHVWLDNHNTVTVGVVSSQASDGNFAATHYELGIDEEPPEFGVTPNCIGFRCSDGQIIYHDGINAVTEHSSSRELTVGECISILIEGTPSGSQVRIMDGTIELGCVALDRVLPSSLKPMVQLNTPNILKQDSGKGRQPGLARVVGISSNHTNGGLTSVKLSFEPQISTAAQTTNELFHVLFNAIRRQYQHLHDHGNLSPSPFIILNESLERAEDCSNHEANTTKAMDVLKAVHDRCTTHTAGTSSNSLPGGFSSKFLTLPRLENNAKTWQSHMVTRAERWMRRMEDKPLLRKGEKARSMHNTDCEPLLIEYLTMEEFLASESIWDRWPFAQYRFLRQFGYHRMRSKVEAIWAFVSAHNLMCEELPSIQEDAVKKFPDLLQRIKEVVFDTKQDLHVLQDLQPRRYFYSKHFLALRLMLSIKLQKLEHFGSEGWLPQQDLELLEESLQDILLDIQRFHPGMGRADLEDGLNNSISQVVPAPESVEPVGSEVGKT